MSITTITGLGSGLDIKNLVPALVEAEKAPKQAQINIQKARNETQLSAVGMLKSALETFESSLLGLKSSSTAFDGYKATSSKEGVASVTLQPNATNITQGSYVLKVDNLASASKVASKVQADGTSTRYAAGELTISIGASGTPHKITVAENSTLDQIRDAINDRLSSVGVTAGIISDSNGARLVLSSELPGAGNDIMVTGATAGAGTGVDLAELNIDGTQQQSGSDAGWLVQSKDAKYSIDGLEMTSKSNVITGVQGLNIRLLEEGTTTLSVATNTDGIAASVESFVMAYNTLLSVTNGLTKVTQTTDKDGNPITQAGALVADSTLRSMMSQLRSALSSPVEGVGDVKLLAQLGVKTNRTTGMLELDSEALKKAVAENPAGIKDFFVGEQGMFERIGNVTSVYSGNNGLLAAREASLTKATERLANDQAMLDRRIEKLTLTLFAKFNAMDSLVARLAATSQSVMATLNALNNKKDD